MSEDITLKDALQECREADALRLLQEKLDAGEAPTAIVVECNEAMIEIGNRFNREEIFLPQLMFAGELMKRLTTKLEPLLSADPSATVEQSKGTVVLGTVQHDVHDIGKDIFAMVLRSSGFTVIDLGVDVAPEEFVSAIRENKPQLVGMSLLLTTCYRSVTKTVEAIEEAGLRDDVLLLVGGAAASDLLAQTARCDHYGKTAVDGLDIALKLSNNA